MCRVIPEQADKTITQSRKMKDLKILLNLKEINGKGVEDQKKKKKILIAKKAVVKSEQVSQEIWEILQEANDAFSTFPPLAFFFMTSMSKS